MSADVDPLHEIRLPGGGGLLRVSAPMTPQRRDELVAAWHAAAPHDDAVMIADGGVHIEPSGVALHALQALMVQFLGARNRARALRQAFADAADTTSHADRSAVMSALVERDGPALAEAEQEVTDLRNELLAAHADATVGHQPTQHSPGAELREAMRCERKWRTRVEEAAARPDEIDARYRFAGVALTGAVVVAGVAVLMSLLLAGLSLGLAVTTLAGVGGAVALARVLRTQRVAELAGAQSRIAGEMLRYEAAFTRLLLAEAGALAEGLDVEPATVETPDDTAPLA